MKGIYSLCFVLMIMLICQDASGQTRDSLIIRTNGTKFFQGDSIYFDATLQYKDVKDAACTINLIIEQIATGRRWKYRYPILNGYLGAGIKIDSSMTDGNYAFNFLLQPQFFSLKGKIKNTDFKEDRIKYMLCTKTMQMTSDTIDLLENNIFNTGRMLFQDSAIIIFSRLSKKRNDLNIELESAIDSIYQPIISVTRLIHIGNADSIEFKKFKKDSTQYQYSNSFEPKGNLLTAVTVQAKAKKLVDVFAGEHVSSLFSSDDAVQFDGLESESISRSADIMSFIRSRVAGFEVEIDEFGSKKLKKRKHQSDIYINEIKVTEDELDDINPSDVAMIKVFRPGTPVAFSSGEGGAIVVYTKIGSYQKNTGNHYTFQLRGYSALDLLWK